MPISRTEFGELDESAAEADLSPETTQGRVYQFLLSNADKAFRQHEIVDAVDVPAGSVGPTLSRLADRGLVDHRGHYWTVADAAHAAATAGRLGTQRVDATDGGFDDDEIERWMDSAVDPVPESAYGDGSETQSEGDTGDPPQAGE